MEMDREFVMSRIPHRDPFLMVDGVIEMGTSHIKAFKDINEKLEVFKGHFPNYPIYPGVLIIEGLAQTAGVLLLEPGSTPLFAGIERARFRGQVRPPCVLEYEVKVIQTKMGVVKVEAMASVEELPVAEAVLLLARA
ncbi:MAG: 3-hydroxyacyl-ACP dehydratase FabZ [Mesotoga infera]